MKTKLRGLLAATIIGAGIALNAFAGQNIINVGTSGNDGTGDPIRSAFQKANGNFTDVYNQLTNIETGTNLVLNATNPPVVPLVIQGATNATTNLLTFQQTPSGPVLSGVSTNGNFRAPPGTPLLTAYGQHLNGSNGMYFPNNSNAVAISIAGAAAVYGTNNGTSTFIGINKTNPAAALDVNGTIMGSNITGTVSNAFITGGVSSNTSFTAMVLKPTNVYTATWNATGAINSTYVTLSASPNSLGIHVGDNLVLSNNSGNFNQQYQIVDITNGNNTVCVAPKLLIACTNESPIVYPCQALLYDINAGATTFSWCGSFGNAAEFYQSAFHGSLLGNASEGANPNVFCMGIESIFWYGGVDPAFPGQGAFIIGGYGSSSAGSVVFNQRCFYDTLHTIPDSVLGGVVAVRGLTNLQGSTVPVKLPIEFPTAGQSLVLKSGSNAKIGTATANGTSAVTVSTTAVTANSLIFLTEQSPAGTPGSPYVASVTAGTGFTFKSVASDTSTVGWFIVEKE